MPEQIWIASQVGAFYPRTTQTYTYDSNSWVVGKNSPTKWMPLDLNTPGSTAIQTSEPTALSSSPLNHWVSAEITGTYDAGTWELMAHAQGITKAGAADGRFIWRLFRGTSIGNATLIARFESNQAFDLGVAILTASASLSSFSLSSERLYLMTTWQIDGAAGSSSSDVYYSFGVNSGTSWSYPSYYGGMKTPNFSDGITGAGSVGTVNVSAPAFSASLTDFEQYQLKMMGVGK